VKAVHRAKAHIRLPSMGVLIDLELGGSQSTTDVLLHL
jgi:hypothetical protein